MFATSSYVNIRKAILTLWVFHVVLRAETASLGPLDNVNQDLILPVSKQKVRDFPSTESHSCFC